MAMGQDPQPETVVLAWESSQSGGLAYGMNPEPNGAHAAPAAQTAMAGAGVAALGASEPVQVASNRTSSTSIKDIAELLLARGHLKPGYRTMVTSPKKGRSALAGGLEIARHLARSGARTVVMSGERNATLTPKGQDAVGGLTDILQGNIEFRDAVRHDKNSGVDMIDAGMARFDWSDARNAETVNRFLDSLDGSYDQVIVAAEPGVGVEFFSLIEGRFDHGVVSGAEANDTATDGMFLGFHIPEFHVAINQTPRRAGQNGIRAQFATAAPAPVVS